MNWGNIGSLLAIALAVGVMAVLIFSVPAAKRGNMSKVAGTVGCTLILTIAFGVAYSGQLPAVGSGIASFIGVNGSGTPAPGFAK